MERKGRLSLRSAAKLKDDQGTIKASQLGIAASE
jgi:hypothetical protein